MNIKEQIEFAKSFIDVVSAEMTEYWNELVDCHMAIAYIEKDIEALKILHLCKTGKLYDES